MKFNDRLLKVFDGSWVAPSPMSRNWESTSAIVALRHDAERIFQHAYPNGDWVWKDPRTCLTLPFWRTVWKQEPVVIFVSREPLEIFLSLRNRDGLGKAHCIALWERYMRSAIAGAHGLPMITISYDQLMEDPIGTITNLRDDLVELGVKAQGNVDSASQCVSTGHGSRRFNCHLQVDHDSTEAQRSLINFIKSLPRTSPKFIASDLGGESATTTELLCAMRLYQPSLSLAVGEVLRAFRRSVAARGLLP